MELLMSSFFKKTGVYAVIFFLILNNLLYAQDARLSNIIISNTRDHLLLFFNAEEAFNEEICKGIQSGIPTSFSYFLTLNNVRNFWIDKEIVDLELTYTIKYNNLKKEYTVTNSWANSKPKITKSFEEAKRFMTEIDSYKICKMEKLEKGEQYQVQIKAELSKITLPLYLHYILFFVSFWDFETDWHSVDFIY